MLTKIQNKLCGACPNRDKVSCPYIDRQKLRGDCLYLSDLTYGYELALQDIQKEVANIKKDVKKDFDQSNLHIPKAICRGQMAALKKVEKIINELEN